MANNQGNNWVIYQQTLTLFGRQFTKPRQPTASQAVTNCIALIVGAKQTGQHRKGNKLYIDVTTAGNLWKAGRLHPADFQAGYESPTRVCITSAIIADDLPHDLVITPNVSGATLCDAAGRGIPLPRRR